ncbi:MAG: DUF3471 domain-containing protein, partial [Spirosomaceae bacterium]|nr:DUF3471 domain-containing protein [Spirosomataceae bacterium]
PYYVFDAFLGRHGTERPETDWSKTDLERNEKYYAEDTRIQDIKAMRVLNTKPSQPLKNYAGTYYTPVYGNIIVSEKNGAMEINFEHSAPLSAKLTHWHYDTFEMTFKKTHPW